jgi:hypothetical protein
MLQRLGGSVTVAQLEKVFDVGFLVQPQAPQCCETCTVGYHEEGLGEGCSCPCHGFGRSGGQQWIGGSIAGDALLRL